MGPRGNASMARLCHNPRRASKRAWRRVYRAQVRVDGTFSIAIPVRRSSCPPPAMRVKLRPKKAKVITKGPQLTLGCPPVGLPHRRQKFRKDRRVEIQAWWCARNDHAASPRAISERKHLLSCAPAGYIRTSSPAGQARGGRKSIGPFGLSLTRMPPGADTMADGLQSQEKHRNL
jgi:hypothetical protein